MARGQRIHDRLNCDTKVKATYGRGRNKDLISGRNRALFYRYYFYSKINKTPYDDILLLLSEQFFLNERTVVNLITEGHSQLKKIYAEHLSAKELQKMFPAFDWKVQSSSAL